MIRKYIYTAIAFLALGSSCSNFTDLDPIDSVGNNEVFSSIDGVEDAVIGAYSNLSLRSTLSIACYISDDVIQGGQAGGMGDDNYKWTYVAAAGDQKTEWQKNYSIINMANRIIQDGPAVETINSEEKERLDNCLGTAYFLRAYAHFDLLRFFSDFETESSLGVPYVLKPHLLDQPARETVETCYNNILADLTSAETLLTEEYDPAYASIAAMHALHARVNLYRGNYEVAASSAEEALRIVPLASMEDYASIWSDDSSEGVIFKLPKASGEEVIGGLFYGGDNSDIFGPSSSFRDSFDETNDIRYQQWVEIGPDREGNDTYINRKYRGTDENVGLNDQKLLRSAEMELIAIESEIHVGTIKAASDRLNAFRALRIHNYSTVEYTTAEELVNELLLERRRELAFEGHRYFDLRRYNLDIVRFNGVNGEESARLPFDNFRQIQPIPETEFQGNNNIQENNPGYSS